MCELQVLGVLYACKAVALEMVYPYDERSMGPVVLLQGSTLQSDYGSIPFSQLERYESGSQFLDNLEKVEFLPGGGVTPT